MVLNLELFYSAQWIYFIGRLVHCILINYTKNWVYFPELQHYVMTTWPGSGPASPRSMGLMTNDERRHSPPRIVDIRGGNEISRYAGILVEDFINTVGFLKRFLCILKSPILYSFSHLSLKFIDSAKLF